MRAAGVGVLERAREQTNALSFMYSSGDRDGSKLEPATGTAASGGGGGGGGRSCGILASAVLSHKRRDSRPKQTDKNRRKFLRVLARSLPEFWLTVSQESAGHLLSHNQPERSLKPPTGGLCARASLT